MARDTHASAVPAHARDPPDGYGVLPFCTVNREDGELPAAPLQLTRGVPAGDTNLVHVNFVPTQIVLAPLTGPPDGRPGTSPDAHRFNASLAESDRAIAEWRSFVNEVRARRRPGAR